MSRVLRTPALLFLCLFILAALPALAQISQQHVDNPGQTAGNPTVGNAVQAPAQPAAPVFSHGVPWRDPNTVHSGPVGFAAPAGAQLSYFNGPIITNTQVIQVLYGSGSYNSQVAGTKAPTMAQFFSDILGSNSGLISLLTQYNTNISGGTNQVFGFGTFGGLFQIVPSSANNGSTITDSQIQSELLSQINGGHLPAPQLDAAGNPNTVYMIYFPPGKTINQGGAISCQAGGFCAYHGTTLSTLGGHNVLYGVLPDMQAGSGCSMGCGASTVFGNYTSVTSHELVEAMTDAFVGIATLPPGPPLAWYDPNFGEIGDICNAQQGSYNANGTTYTIQLEFSNSANNCVLPPTVIPDFTLAASPSSLTVVQGSSGSSTITVAASGGFTGAVTLSNSALPSGVTASYSTNPATSTSSVTFTASSTAATGTSAITITGTSGALTHTTTINLTINVPPDFTLAASPSSLTVVQGSSGSSTITVAASGGFTGAVTLSNSALPSGVTASYSTNPATSTSSVTFTASSTATTGTSAITITGTSGTLTHTTTVNLTVLGPISIAKAFGAASIPVNGKTTLTFTISNQDAAVALSGVSFSDTLPAGLAVANPNGLTGSCGSGTITTGTVSGFSVVNLSGGTIAAGGSCTFSVIVVGMTSGVKVNTTGTVTSSNAGSGNQATATITVVGAPPLAKMGREQRLLRASPVQIAGT